DPFLASGLEQQWNIENHDRRLGGFRVSKELLPGGTEHGVDDLLELLDRRGVVHDACRQFGPVDLAVRGGAGEGGLNRRCSLALVELMDCGISVVNGHAGLREQFRGCGFAHSDRAGQSENSHQRKTILVGHTAISCSRRRNASNGSNGRPRMVKWSPSTRSNRWMPRPSS